MRVGKKFIDWDEDKGGTKQDVVPTVSDFLQESVDKNLLHNTLKV